MLKYVYVEISTSTEPSFIEIKLSDVSINMKFNI